ncbi:MAG: oligosaccharide flippase family protein [Anaerolineae bacterium]|nr:oligosaccharide flippase family protein [Anaerolineae bacterium]
MIASLRQRFKILDSRFLKSSAILAAGFALARFLGLGFSLLLGRMLPAERYGYIQYIILIAGLLSIPTMPFFQHLVARQVSIHRDNTEQLHRVYTNAWIVMFGLCLLTVLFTIPLFVLAGTLDLGAYLIFFGVTLFYAYYGLARGFEDSTRLAIVFVSSNLIQLVVIAIVYVALREQSVLPALAIYGLSYVVPVLLITALYPLPVRIRLKYFDWKTMKELIVAAVPIWISHSTYAFANGADVFILRRFSGDAVVGAYTFTKTLNIVFDFVPSALGTMIMPRAASMQSNRRRLMLMSAVGVLAISAVIAVVYLSLYQWIILSFFKPEYLLPAVAVITMIAMQTIFGLQGVISGMLIGVNRPAVEMGGRIITVISLYVTCLLLIPPYGVVGAAVANLISSIISVGSFVVLLELRKRHERQQIARKEQSMVAPNAAVPMPPDMPTASDETAVDDGTDTGDPSI